MKKTVYPFDDMSEQGQMVLTAMASLWVDTNADIVDGLGLTKEDATWALCQLIEKRVALVHYETDEAGKFTGYWIEIDQSAFIPPKPH